MGGRGNQFRKEGLEVSLDSILDPPSSPSKSCSSPLHPLLSSLGCLPSESYI